MKSVCSILILAFVVHSQCGAQCLSADLDNASHGDASSAEAPPCHQQTEIPSPDPSNQDSSRHSHDQGNSCGQAQSSESKIAPISKFALQPAAMEFVASPACLLEPATRITLVIGADTLFAYPPPTHQFVLRI